MEDKIDKLISLIRELRENKNAWREEAYWAASMNAEPNAESNDE